MGDELRADGNRGSYFTEAEFLNKLSKLIGARKSRWNWKERNAKLHAYPKAEPDDWIYPRHKISWWLWCCRSLHYHIARQEWSHVRITLHTIIDCFGISKYTAVVWNVTTLLEQIGIPCKSLAKVASTLLESCRLQYELVALDTVHRLTMNKDIEAIEGTLQHLLSRAPNQRKRVTPSRLHVRLVLNCYEGLFYYLRWKKCNDDPFDGEPFLKLGCACFSEVLRNYGVWDFIIPPYLDMLISVRNLETAFNSLVQYLKSDPTHGNAVSFLFDFLRRNQGETMSTILLEHTVMYCSFDEQMYIWLSEVIDFSVLRLMSVMKLYRVLVLLSLRVDEFDLRDSCVIWKSIAQVILFLMWQLFGRLPPLETDDLHSIEVEHLEPMKLNTVAYAKALRQYQQVLRGQRHFPSHFHSSLSQADEDTDVLYYKSIVCAIVLGTSSNFFQEVMSDSNLSDLYKLNLVLVSQVSSLLCQVVTPPSQLSLPALLRTDVVISYLERVTWHNNSLQMDLEAFNSACDTIDSPIRL